MKPFPRLTLASHCVRCLLATLFVLCAVRGATLSDFGHGRMSALGTRPLLVVLVNYQGQSPLTGNRSFYSNLIFNVSGTMTQNVVGFFLENSNGRFSWSMAGVVGPLQLGTDDAALSQPDFHSNIVAKAILRNLFNPGSFDSNGDTFVTQDELQLMMFSTLSSIGDRGFGCVKTTNSNVTVCGSIADLPDQTDFGTLCHELGHTLGPIDLYGAACRSLKLSLMSCTGTSSNDTFHMDPWHKMQLGWSRPRLVTLNTGGVFSLPAQQLQQQDAPILLYDRNRILREFFMLEYRTSIRNNGQPWTYDANVAANGLAIWHVQHSEGLDPLIICSEPYLNAQISWTYCDKCAVLWFAPNSSNSRCPADDLAHSDKDSLHWLIFDSPSDPGESGWRRCQKCQGLFYGPNQINSNCPVGDRHESPTSLNFNYTARTNPVDGGEASWFRCSKCEGMFNTNFHAKISFPITCAAGGRHSHLSGGVPNATYSIHRSDRAMFNLSAPALARDSSELWGSGTNTPYLRWLDGTFAKTWIRVRPFNPGDPRITVEVLTDEETWLDFNYAGSENGSFLMPWNTLAEAVENAPWFRTVKVKAGSRIEPALISKPLAFEAPLGTATVLGR